MGKLAFVVGIGPGMGTAIAKRFRAEGFAIAGFARSERTLDRAREALGAPGPEVRLLAADAAEPDSLRGALDAASAELGAPDVLIYNVSVLRQAPPSRVTADALNEDFRANVTGALVAAQAVLPAMRAARKGTLLFTGGGLAIDPLPAFSSLAVGKAAMRSLALSFASELAGDGIHAATVTIAGMIKAGTHFDPDAIAAHFWRLHAQGPGAWDVEFVYR